MLVGYFINTNTARATTTDPLRYYLSPPISSVCFVVCFPVWSYINNLPQIFNYTDTTTVVSPETTPPICSYDWFALTRIHGNNGRLAKVNRLKLKG